MAEIIPRISPLADIVVRGRFGADKGAPGVELSVRRPCSIVSLIARKGKANALVKALDELKNCTVQWAGAEQYYAVSERDGEAALYVELKAKLAGLAAVCDQSHGRAIICISGSRARIVLAKGTPVDLHTDEFPVGKSAVTQMAHVGVHLTRTGADSFEMSVFRGFAESFWEWLTEQAEEFGYRVI